ncbi:MAG TPA: tetratricopeptide repeat protein, partial [Cellvibrio sp.]|nr:tetratricopeptide repeat protein [Cellvibrio sp.]
IAYMAPERLLGAPLAPQIDIYALGVIFYELLTGQRPFAELNGLGLAAALVQSSSDQWHYAQELSPQLIHIIRRMTAKQVAQRLSSMADVLLQLDALENDANPENSAFAEIKLAPPEAVPVPASKTKSPKQLRHQHLKNAVLFSVVVIGCVVFGGWLTRNYLWRFEEVIPRYSESQEMKLGMDALEQWDRPGSLDSAIKHFNNLAEQNPENAAAIAGLSIAYSLKYQGDQQDEIYNKKSIASAQQAIKLAPRLVLAQTAQGRALLEQGSYDKALQYFEASLKLDSLNKFAWYGKIEVLVALKQYDKAVEMAKNGTEKFPKTRTFYDRIGSVYASQGKYQEAEVAFRKSISIQPDSIYPYANLGLVLLNQGRQEDSIHILQQGLQIRPSAWLYTNLGNAFFYNGDYLRSVEAFEDALRPELGNTDDYLAWANLADALLWLPGRKKDARKNYERACALLDEILTRHPNDLRYISRLALYKARLQLSDESRVLLERLRSHDSENPQIHYRIALAYELIGERKLALREIAIAKNLGYPLNLIEGEPDFEFLRRDPAYDLY